MEESILGEPPSHLKYDPEPYKSPSSHKFKKHAGNHHHHAANSPPRVDFPIFDGTNPRAWIIKCNTYFKIVKNVEEDEKVPLASMYFEGKAASWYHSFDVDNHDVTWSQFVEMLSNRFEELKKSQIVDDFNKLKFTGDYGEFVEKFEELKNCMKLIYGELLDEDYYISSFLSGLTPELKIVVRMMKPTTVQAAIEMGRDQLDTIEAITKKVKLSNRPVGNGSGVHTIRSFVQNPVKTPNQPRPQVKLLTSAEMSARREKGLCFNCDEKFTPGHKCTNRLFMIMTETEELSYLQSEGMEREAVAEQVESDEDAHISLNAIQGNDGISTMRFIGSHGDYQLQILIDSGSTMSFIRESTAMRLNHPLEVVSPLVVKVANGQKMVSSHVAADFPWELQGINCKHSLRLLQNEGCDIILGCDWIKAHSSVKFDYDRMRVTVKVEGKKVRFQAQESTAICQYISHQSLYKLMHTTDKRVVKELYLVTPQRPTYEDNLDLSALLDAYEDIFQEPNGLPPSRGTEHQIALKP